MRTDDGFNLEIRRGLPSELRSEAAQLYLEAFERKLSPMLGTGERATGLLENALEPELCLVALEGSRLLGLVGMQFGGRAFTQFGWDAFVRAFGPLSGSLRFGLLALLDRPHLPRQLTLDGLAVAPEARSRGVGRALLGAVLEYAQRHGFASVRLDVVDTNPRARALYERLGFRQTATQRLPLLERWLGFAASSTMVKSL